MPRCLENFQQGRRQNTVGTQNVFVRARRAFGKPFPRAIASGEAAGTVNRTKPVVAVAKGGNIERVASII